MTEPTTPLGVIVDTNSGGRFDLIVYEDGILGVKGTYVGVALRAGGAGMVGGGGSGLSGAAAAGALGGVTGCAETGGLVGAPLLVPLLSAPLWEAAPLRAPLPSPVFPMPFPTLLPLAEAGA